MNLPRSLVALITPMTPQEEVDFEALEKLIDWHIAQDSEGLVLCGSTGEGALLSSEEKCLVFETAVKKAKGQLFLVANTGSSSTKQSLALTIEAKNLGVDCAIIIVPYYVKPTMEGAFRHFQALDSLNFPLIAYHHPGRTGVRLGLNTLVKIGKLPNVVGIKEASCDLDLAFELRKELSISLFSGDDTLSLAHFAACFDGSINIVGNLIPRQWQEYVQTACSGNLEKAGELFRQSLPLCKALVKESNPQGVKYALGQMGMCHPHLRAPLMLPSQSIRKEIEKELDALGLIDSPYAKIPLAEGERKH